MSKTQTTDPYSKERPPIQRSEPGRLVIVKSDRLCASAMRVHAALSCGAAQIEIVHTGQAAIAALLRYPCRLAVVGLTLPDMDGLDLVCRLLKARAGTRVLIVSSRQDQRVREVIWLPFIAGFFDSSAEEPKFFKAVLRRTWEGGTYFSDGLMRDLFSELSDRKSKQALTLAERRVLGAIGDGSDDNDAAHCLQLSAHTIHAHRQNIMRKLGVHTRAELMRMAIQLGYIRITPTHVMRPGLARFEPNEISVSVPRP